jgi:hypothetical protein
MTRGLGSLPASIVFPLKFKTKAVGKAFQSFAVALNPVQWRAHADDGWCCYVPFFDIYRKLKEVLY